jgi:opine dehydrogenase
MKIAVLGAGHGGYAIAADLTLAGHEVNLFNRSPGPIEAINKAGGIRIHGESVYGEGFAKLNKATTDIKEAIEGTEIIMIATPAYGHEYMIEKSMPYLKDDQIIVFNTGNFASLRLANELKKRGKNNPLVETAILLYSCRKDGPASVFVDGLKKKLDTAVFPSVKTKEIFEIVGKLYPQLIPAKNVLQTSLENLNFIFHPQITILNTGFVERTKGDFIFYKDGVTPSVGTVMEAVDEERIRIGKAFGFEMVTAKEYLDIYYGAKGSNLYEAIQNCKPYLDPGERGPPDFSHRYIAEDVPYGLVPLSSIGKLIKSPTPVIDSMITLASTINRVDYFKEGFTVEKLGLAGMSKKEILEYVTYGWTKAKRVRRAKKK